MSGTCPKCGLKWLNGHGDRLCIQCAGGAYAVAPTDRNHVCPYAAPAECPQQREQQRWEASGHAQERCGTRRPPGC